MLLFSLLCNIIMTLTDNVCRDSLQGYTSDNHSSLSIYMFTRWFSHEYSKFESFHILRNIPILEIKITYFVIFIVTRCLLLYFFV